MNEAALISGCLKGQRKEQEQFYHHFAGKMMGICRRYTQNREEAEDVFQEAFAKVFQTLGSFSGQGPLEAWVKRVFVNTAINYYHKHKRHHDHIDAAYIEEMQENCSSIISELQQQELLQLINQLPDGYRMVFNLYAIEGYAHKEISEMLGITEGTSKSQLFKAKAMLQKELAQKSALKYS